MSKKIKNDKIDTSSNQKAETSEKINMTQANYNNTEDNEKLNDRNDNKSKITTNEKKTNKNVNSKTSESEISKNNFPEEKTIVEKKNKSTSKSKRKSSKSEKNSDKLENKESINTEAVKEENVEENEKNVSDKKNTLATASDKEKQNKEYSKNTKSKSTKKKNEESTKQASKNKAEKVAQSKESSPSKNESEDNAEVRLDEKSIKKRNSEELVEKNNEKDKDESLQDEKKDNEGGKYNAISLKEIREKLGTKVSKEQKKGVVKEVLTNIVYAVLMIAYLFLVMKGSFNIGSDYFEKDIKIITLSILAIGITILEVSYKKDNTKIAMHGVEVIVFAASNLCLIYVIKLYFDRLTNIITYLEIAVALYYVVKSLIISIRSVNKYKKNNNDIREIVKKKVKEI